MPDPHFDIHLICGATGAGKSALVNLVPRFYDTTDGRITIDGHDVRDIPQDQLREIVGIALQEALLFQGDVRFNLKFGAEGIHAESIGGGGGTGTGDDTGGDTDAD